jgi:hypothetical protein
MGATPAAMNCRTCNYPLWNIRDRRCPECGTEFRPSDFRFVPGAVRFCCPHCAQSYYGTSAEGHLQPPEFACVKCGRAVGMDEMVMLPAEGVAEDLTAADRMPWLDERRRFLSRWFGAIGWSMAMPIRLIRATPVESSLPSAAWFCVLTTTVYSLLGLGPYFLIPMIFIGPRAGGASFAVLTGLLVGVLSAALGALLLYALWALVTHGLLRLGGTTESGIRRTYQCFCFASGADALRAVPCLGLHLTVVAWVWPAVSAILMVRQSQRVSALRACFAVLTPPLTILALLALWIAAAVFSGLPATTSYTVPPPAPTAGAAQGGAETARAQAVLDALRKHADNPPGHAARLVASRELAPTQFVLSQTGGPGPESILVGRTTLRELSGMADSAQERELARAEAEMPKDVIAHRVGDVVFTHHGVDMKNGNEDLWLFVAEIRTAAPAGPVITPDPSMPGPRIRTRRPRPIPTPAPGQTSVWLVGTNGGTVNIVTDLLTATAEQNQLRSEQGLPPLPIASDVKTWWPVTSSNAAPKPSPTAPEQPAPTPPPD